MFVYFFSHPDLFEHYTIWEVMGFRTKGLLSALVVPLLLTMILFLGPLSVQLTNGIWKIYSGWSSERNVCIIFYLSLFLEPMFWVNYCHNLLWLRNHVVAPLSEEFTFRAIMLPLLLQSFSPMTSIFITPLFFGVGERRHIDQFQRLFLTGCFLFQRIYIT